MLEELEDEARWKQSFSQSQDVLAKLAAEAMEEDLKGETKELDPDLPWNQELQKVLERHSPHYRNRFRIKHEERMDNSGKIHGIQAYGSNRYI